MATIMFNGKSYSSLEEMPPNDRQAYEQMMSIFVDANGNGIPDFLEGDIVQNVMTAVTSNIHFNGQVYDGMNELPVDVREKIQGAFEKMTELGIVTKTDSPVVIGFNSDQASKDPQIQSRPFISREFSPAIEEDKGSNALPWILAGIALLFCLVLAAFAVFYIMGYP